MHKSQTVSDGRSLAPAVALAQESPPPLLIVASDKSPVSPTACT